MTRPLPVIVALVVAGLVAGCGAAPVTAPAVPVPTIATTPSATVPATPSETVPATSATVPVTANAVVIRDFVFVPATITVAAGATVTVDNQDGANHTMTATDGSFDTGNIPGRATGTFTAPTKPGSYPYKCAIHPFMTGTLVVT